MEMGTCAGWATGLYVINPKGFRAMALGKCGVKPGSRRLAKGERVMTDGRVCVVKEAREGIN